MKNKFKILFLLSAIYSSVFCADGQDAINVLSVISAAINPHNTPPPPPGNKPVVHDNTKTVVPTGAKTPIAITAPKSTITATIASTAIIPSAITALNVIPATNIGDLYTVITFSAANLTTINQAITSGKSLVIIVNVQQNNANYNVTATVYDLQNNQIAQEVRQNVVNASSASNSLNVAQGSAITTAAVFTYYGVDLEVTGQEEQQQFDGLSLSEAIVLAASVQSVPVDSALQSMKITAMTNISNLYAEFNLTERNIIDINLALSQGEELTLAVYANTNTSGKCYDIMCEVYNSKGALVAQEVRRAVVNKSTVANTANIASGSEISLTAAEFTTVNVAMELLATSEVLAISNIPVTSTIALTSALSPNSVIALPEGVTAVTALQITPSYGTTVGSAISITASDLALMNAALAQYHAVAIQAEVEGKSLSIGVYDYMNKSLVAMESYPIAATQASAFSSYKVSYTYQGQTNAQPVALSAGDVIILFPAMPSVTVQSSIAAGVNGATAFSSNPSSLTEVIAVPGFAYNHMIPATIAGGLKALKFISAQFTDANSTAYLKFDFTVDNGLQNITQSVLNNGLYIAFNIVTSESNAQTYEALVTLEDAQGNVYASGSAPITTQMVWGWVGFNMETSSATAGANMTSVKQVPIANGLPVLYCQQSNVTSPLQ